MKYKYDKNLRLSFVSYEDRLATYIKHPGEGCLLIRDTNRLVVASFKYGFCNNVSTFEVNDAKKAWDFFEKIRNYEEPIIYEYKEIKMKSPEKILLGEYEVRKFEGW